MAVAYGAERRIVCRILIDLVGVPVQRVAVFQPLKQVWILKVKVVRFGSAVGDANHLVHGVVEDLVTCFKRVKLFKQDSALDFCQPRARGGLGSVPMQCALIVHRTEPIMNVFAVIGEHNRRERPCIVDRDDVRCVPLGCQVAHVQLAHLEGKIVPHRGCGIVEAVERTVQNFPVNCNRDVGVVVGELLGIQVPQVQFKPSGVVPHHHTAVQPVVRQGHRPRIPIRYTCIGRSVIESLNRRKVLVHVFGEVLRVRHRVGSVARILQDVVSHRFVVKRRGNNLF